MPDPDFFIAFDRVKSLSLRQFTAALQRNPKRVVGTVQLKELCAMSHYPNGLYLLFSADGTLQYVGKATSRSFIERIPSHFDPRENAWFNTLPKRLLSRKFVTHYAEALALSLSFELVLLGVQGKQTAQNLERALRSSLQPLLNAGKVGLYSGEELLSSYESKLSPRRAQ